MAPSIGVESANHWNDLVTPVSQVPVFTVKVLPIFGWPETKGVANLVMVSGVIVLATEVTTVGFTEFLLKVTVKVSCEFACAGEG